MGLISFFLGPIHQLVRSIYQDFQCSQFDHYLCNNTIIIQILSGDC